MNVPSRKLEGILEIFGDEVIPDDRMKKIQSGNTSDRPEVKSSLPVETIADKDIME